MPILPKRFQAILLAWFDEHGRKQLPWQQNKTPYRVWVSEIMLQQTQVNTVIPYFERFMLKFPDLASLAQAPEDAVLHIWAGLGYYSRARNLHKAAKTVVLNHCSKLPCDKEALKALPGIGESTAGAILSIAFDMRAPILDGNVKRVLARFHGIKDPIDETLALKKLWHLAEKYTPLARTADYTQAMMDLGATVCTRRQPHCLECPFIKHCAAFKQSLVNDLPIKSAARKLPVKQATFIILKKNHFVLLKKRARTGIWGGLYSFPELPGQPDIKTLRAFCKKHYSIALSRYYMLNSFRHTFSHYHLDIFPVIIPVKQLSKRTVAESPQIWYNPDKPNSVGLPKPIQTILRGLAG